MGRSITISKKTIHPGESAQVILNGYPLPNKQIFKIPVYVFNGHEPGPSVLLLAGMHGDEINGIEIIRRLITRTDVRHPLRGSVIAIPIINQISFLYGSRDLPDGRDLNRCFPGTRSGSLGSQIAYDLMNQVIPQIDFGVDFHTGGARICNYPQIRCVFGNETNLDLAKRFSAPQVINSPFRDSTLRKEAAKKGKSILVFEGGESSRFDYFAINEGINGCLRLLKSLDMIDGIFPDNVPVYINKSSWLRAKGSGLFHTSKSNGSHIRKGDLLGMICSPYGEVEQKLSAPYDGYIIGVNNLPVINQGDALIHVGAE